MNPASEASLRSRLSATVQAALAALRELLGGPETRCVRGSVSLGRSIWRADEKLVEVDGRFEWGAPKTARSNRVVDLPDLIVAPLAEHLLRFPDLAARVRAGQGEGVRPEWLRHTGASLAYAATKDMKAVGSRLGHTSTRMMDTVYVDVYPEVSRQVADAIDALVRASLDSGTA